MRVNRGDFLFYLAGGVLLALPALTATDAPASWLIPMLGGLLLLVIATVRARLEEEWLALALVVTLNISFWISLGVWQLKIHYAGSLLRFGIDPFTGAVALWGFLLIAVSFYALVAFLRGLGKKEHQKLCVAGLACLSAQMLVTFRYIRLMMEGV